MQKMMFKAVQMYRNMHGESICREVRTEVQPQSGEEKTKQIMGKKGIEVRGGKNPNKVETNEDSLRWQE